VQHVMLVTGPRGECMLKELMIRCREFTEQT
jgi:hypothetical protein